MRVLIQHKADQRRFVVVESSNRDGSLTLAILKEGVSKSFQSWSTKSGEQSPQQIDLEKPRSKTKRITIHQSGRINYHENGRSIFIEPLTAITQATRIYGYRIPALGKLDLYAEALSTDDSFFDLTELDDGPVSFSFIIGPATFVPPGKAIKLSYEAERYALAIAVDNEPLPVPQGYEDHFTTFSPERGPFLEQQMAEDQAMIAYHRALTDSTGLILYEPNGEGFIRMIFSVQMRIPPRFKIELEDPELHVSDQDVQRDERSEKVMLKFKVRNRRTGQIMRQQVAVRSIELDAEL